ncbi:hypothetical protein [Bowmanella dokdonensis]|uniref:Uncharacterized protein n=1 Tax=Bowmanella dokdonensis TaxID=751969 RepID=A0A939IPY8_9ALTE|nr:hypothetical protein [Bowmanella dokdonensis]MBN7826365.1 hypothetical protein [Bowmanella dokdonensis]
MFDMQNPPLWQKAPHNAFTDLCLFRNQLFCCFREAGNHISADGTVRILCLAKNGGLLRQQKVSVPGVDLRDPKLSVTPDGKLLLLAYARYATKDNKTLYGQPTTWLSQDGQSWSSAKAFADKNWWLWRLTWHAGRAYGVAYNRSAQQVRLYAGNPRATFDCIEPDLFSLKTRGKGYPNESDLLFQQDGTLLVLLRRDADSCTAQLGIAKPPYRRWQWQDLGFYLGGPAMKQLDDKTALLAGRIWQKRGPKTALVSLDLHSKKAKLLKVLPSAGDNSYPGLVLDNGDLYVSYYSSHLQHKACIYLHHFRLDSLMIQI